MAPHTDRPVYFSLLHTTRAYPRLPYEAIKNSILGTQYTLSLVFIGAQRARTLNRTHRRKTYTPNVLSFALDATHGEIFVTPERLATQAKERGITIRRYAGFLFIHALLHLKGMRHGDTMDTLEKKYCIQFHLR